MSIECFNYSGLVNLQIAIVQSVVEDFRKSNDKAQKSALLKWFLTDYGQLLCCGNGEYIVSQLGREIL